MGRPFQHDDAVGRRGTTAPHLSAGNPYGLGGGHSLPQPGLWSMGRGGYGNRLTKGSRIPQRKKGVLSSKAAKTSRGSRTHWLHEHQHCVRALPMGKGDAGASSQMAASYHWSPSTARPGSSGDDARHVVYAGEKTRKSCLGIRGATPENRAPVLL